MAFLQPWWQTAVIYQIYPRSLQDTDGDGVGDLRGILARLDYFVGLGVDALWISPVYPSPMADFGYDVADYTGIDPLFGTLADFDALLAAAHAKRLKLILDFVPNHTSDVHPWFLDSSSSRNDPRRDWYLWHDPVPYPWLAPGDDTRPKSEQYPNNWQSQFGGPAWTWDETTEQFYLHSFLRQQPDLNWRNPDVCTAMFDAMRFWLGRGVEGRGVDGFRMDVLWLLIKDGQFRNNEPGQPARNADQPETQRIVADMRTLLDSYGDSALSANRNSQDARLLIGEIYLPLPDLVRYYGEPAITAEPESTPHLTGANLPFNFALIQTAWQAEAIAAVITQYEALLPRGAWPNYVLGNHDQSRLATRIGPAQARVAAMLLLTLRGTPTMYYGDELGMTDVPIRPDQVRDPAERNQPGQGKGRDPERSPMLWVDAPNAGFCPPGVDPWLPVLADYPTRNAAAQQRDRKSILSLYRFLLALRRQHDTLHSGAIADVGTEGTLLRFRRVAPAGSSSTDFLVLLNLGAELVRTRVPAGTVVLTTILDGQGSAVSGDLVVEGNEGILLALDESPSA